MFSHKVMSQRRVILESPQTMQVSIGNTRYATCTMYLISIGTSFTLDAPCTWICVPELKGLFLVIWFFFLENIWQLISGRDISQQTPFSQNAPAHFISMVFSGRANRLHQQADQFSERRHDIKFNPPKDGLQSPCMQSIGSMDLCCPPSQAAGCIL